MPNRLAGTGKAAWLGTSAAYTVTREILETQQRRVRWHRRSGLRGAHGRAANSFPNPDQDVAQAPALLVGNGGGAAAGGVALRCEAVIGNAFDSGVDVAFEIEWCVVHGRSSLFGRISGLRLDLE